MKRPLLNLGALLALASSAPVAGAAADLGLTFHDDLTTGVERTYVTAGGQVAYLVEVRNTGDQTATGVALGVNLPPAISQATWTATYEGGAEGPVVGAAAPQVLLVLPPASVATFTIVATTAVDATGAMVATATASQGGQVVTASDADVILPPVLSVSDTVGVGAASRVGLVNPVTNATLGGVTAFDPSFRGGVHTALPDMDGDGRSELVVASGPGRPGEVRVFALGTPRSPHARVGSRTGRTAARAIRSLRPFGAAYRGGVTVAAGDFDGDGRDDIAVAQSAPPHRVHAYLSRPSAPRGLRLIRSFVPRFLAGSPGVSLAAADVGTFRRGITAPAVPDGRAELVVAGGAGTRARVQVRDVTRPSAPVLDAIPVRGASPATGITVAAARVSKDSIPDLIITGVGRGTGRIVVYDGIVGRARNPVLTTFAPREPVVPGAPVGVAGIDTDADGRANVIRVASQGSTGPVLGIHRITHTSRGQVVVAGGVAGPGAAGGAMASAPRPATGIVTTQSGLQYRDLVVGTGATPSGAGATVRVAQEGWLLDGTRFDGPRYASISLGDAIAGWSEGLGSMRVGGRRQLIIPANLAYGAAGTATIPPNATIVFDVELLSAT